MPSHDVADRTIGVACDLIALDIHPAETYRLAVDGTVRYVNRSGAKLFGRKSAEVASRPLADFVADPEDRIADSLRRCAGSSSWAPLSVTLGPGPLEGMRLAFKGRGVRRPSDGEVEILLVADPGRIPIFDEHRRLIADLNARLAEQRKLSRDLDESLASEARLHQELIHRVKNNLTLLNSLIRVRAGATDSPEAKAALKEIESRVMSIALVHEILDQQNEIDIVDGNMLIERLCSEMETSICPAGVTIHRNLEPYRLHVSEATPLALLVNELVTNSLKHAFEGREGGVVNVSLKRNGTDKLEVHVADNGRGFDASRPGQGGGSRIVSALAEQLGAELNVRSDAGTSWQLIFAPSEPSIMKVA